MREMSQMLLSIEAKLTAVAPRAAAVAWAGIETAATLRCSRVSLSTSNTHTHAYTHTHTGW